MAGSIRNKLKGLFAKEPKSGLDQPPETDRTARVGRPLPWRHASPPGEGSAERARSPRCIGVRVWVLHTVVSSHMEDTGEMRGCRLSNSLEGICFQLTWFCFVYDFLFLLGVGGYNFRYYSFYNP